MYEPENFNNIKTVTTSAIRMSVAIYRLAQKIKEKEKISMREAIDRARNEFLKYDKNFLFTGKHTDLIYFEKTSAMPIDFVERIQDEALRSAVKDEFNKAARKGYIVIDPDSQMIVITEKGRKHIDKYDFVEEAADNVQTAFNERDRIFLLKPDESVLGMFEYSDQVELKNFINDATPEQHSELLKYFEDLNKKGIIKMKDGAVELTEKGKQLFDSLKKAGKFKDFLKVAGSLNGVGAIAFVVENLTFLKKTR